MDNTREYVSIFDNITDEEFEEILKECNFDYKRVKQGQGGLYINGKKVDDININFKKEK